MKKIGLFVLTIFIISLLSAGVYASGPATTTMSCPEESSGDLGACTDTGNGCRCIITDCGIPVIIVQEHGKGGTIDNGGEISCEEIFVSTNCQNDVQQVSVTCAGFPPPEFVIPELSTYGIFAAIVAIGLGTAFIVRRKKK